MELKETEIVNRGDINISDYNPRKIDKDSREKLKKSIKKYGLVQPLIVNRRTNNIVGGHQRIEVLDEIKKTTDYTVPVIFVDLDEAEEVNLNVLLNNPSVQGEFDWGRLKELKDIFPDINFEEEMGFTKLDIEMNLGEEFVIQEEEKMAVVDIEKLKKAKRKNKQDKLAADASGETDQYGFEDYKVVLVFKNNSEKYEFMRKIMQDEKEKFIDGNMVKDLIKEHGDTRGGGQ